MVYEIEIFLTGLFFVLFFIIISIFGFILIFKIYKEIIELPFLEVIALSLGCGIIFFICYSYILDTFLFFNFFTALFPLIIFDIGGLIYYIKSNLKFKKKLCFQNIKLILSKHRNTIFLFILISIIVYFYQIQIQYEIIIKQESQLASDPFMWFRAIMYLIDYGHLEYEIIEAYSAGYVFLNAAMISFYPTFRFAYFFLKFVPIFYMSLFIFIGFIASRLIFKQKFIFFLAMFGFLTLRYFNYRILMPLPSVPATILFFIFSIVFIDPKIPYYFKGILLAGPFLFHPFFGVLSIAIFIIYIFLQYFVFKIKLKKNIKFIFKENSYNLIIFFGLLIPFFVNLTLKYKIDWLLNYWHYIFPACLSNFNMIVKINTNYASIINCPLILSGTFTYNNLEGYFKNIMDKTFLGNPIIFVIIIYFLIIIKKKNYQNFGNFIDIIKITIIFTFIFQFLYYFMVWFFPLETFGELVNLMYFFKPKIFEFNGAFIVFGGVFMAHDIYFNFSKITLMLKKKIPRYKKFLNGNPIRTSKEKIFHIIKSPWKIESIVIIIVLCFSYNLYQNNEFWYHYHYRDDNFVEMILAIGDSEPPNLNTKKTILLPGLEIKAVLGLLYRFNFKFIDFTQNYTTLIDKIIYEKASYVVLPINQLSENKLSNFVSDYEIFYQNVGYVVIKVD